MELKVYRALTYLLAIPNAFITFITIFGILAAIANPVLLFPMIFFVATVIYAISSFIFLQKGILENKKCLLKLKKRIKNTSILTGLFCLLNITNSIKLLANKNAIDLMVTTFFAENKNFVQAGLTPEMLISILTFCTYFMGIYAALLLLHILMTYKFTKLYADVFIDPTIQP